MSTEQLDPSQETMIYYLDRMRECIIAREWRSIPRYIKYLGYMVFFAEIVDDRKTPKMEMRFKLK